MTSYLYQQYKPALPPGVFERIEQAADTVHRRLASIDLENAGISAYSQRALRIKLANPLGHLQIYGNLLCLALAGASTSLEQFTFIEYGGGVGVFSLLAKASGIATVIYNDIYELSCQDAQTIARQAGIQLDAYICCDMDGLIDYVAQKGYTINAIASWDVIEHIYDIETYLKKLRLLSQAPFRAVFGSGANARNPLIRRKLEKKQRRCEYQRRQRQWGHKERDTLEGYYDARKGIIKAYAPDLPAAAIDDLAGKTRGLMISDIHDAVDEYRGAGIISFRPAGAYNTCDPYTGNWAEHLMDPDHLTALLFEERFSVRILSGYWPYSKATYKNLIMKPINAVIRKAGARALAIAPYYVVCADRG
jgi:hypothetical protein